MKAQEKPTPFLESAAVKVTTVVSAGVVLMALAVNETRHRTNQDRDMKELQSKLAAIVQNVTDLNTKIVGKTPSGFHRQDMVEWVRRTAEKNTQWDPATIPWVRPDGRIDHVDFETR